MREKLVRDSAGLTAETADDSDAEKQEDAEEVYSVD